MSYHTCNNKTISNEISDKDNKSYNEYTIIISLRLFIRETTQCILPYPPYSILVTHLVCMYMVDMVDS